MPDSPTESPQDAPASADVEPVNPVEQASSDDTSSPERGTVADPEDSATPEAQAGADASGSTAPAKAEAGVRLRQRFPALFGSRAKPIKLQVQQDIQARAPGEFSRRELSAFFSRYTRSTPYLIAVSRAKERFDLDGEPSGPLADEHRDAAVQELTRRRAGRREREELEEQQRRNRARLLHDFERTTLTAPNFCALMGVDVAELESLLDRARAEAAERPLPPPAATSHRPGAPPRRPRRE